jgi:Uma2 family endonuclease
MAPLGGSSSLAENELSYLFTSWAKRDGRGRVFGSNAGFNLPNGAMRSPDISWVRNERLERLTEEQWEKFLPLCPDFVLELRSPSDSMRALKEKMEEFIANGSELGWLLDPERKQVLIYRPGQPPQLIENPGEISGEPVLRGFTLDVRQIWRAMQRR